MVERSAIVVGAGLAGLATAIGLTRAGWKVTVCDKASALTPAGFGIGITTNGLQALAELGAYEAVSGEGCAAADALVKNTRGELITTVRARTIGDRYGMPTRIFHRAALQRALLSQLPSDSLRLDARCVALENRGSEVIVDFADGSRASAALLIGADGVDSSVRRFLHGPDPLRYAHYFIWLAVMELSHPVLTPGYNAHYWGEGSRFGIHDIGGGQWYWWGTKNSAHIPERLRALHMAHCEENRAERSELTARFADWPDEVRHAIDSTPDERIFLVNSRDRKPLTRWSRGRVTLLGDAAHPMLTSLGQGAVMGFEDAAVLVQCLRHEIDVARALLQYERLRLPKTSAVVAASRRMSDIEQARTTRGARLRNFAFRHLPNSLAERELERMSTFSLPTADELARAAPPPTSSENARSIVIVSGASSGIGRAIAVQLAEAGYQVLAGVRSAALQAELRSLGYERLTPVLLDVVRQDSIDAVLSEVQARVARGDQLWAVVNNAAVCATGPLEGIPHESLRAHFEVNVLGTAALTQAALPLLIAARGRVVNIGSNVGRVAPPFLGPYAASKAALEAMGDVLRRELAPHGVQVSLVIPGPVLTPVWDKLAASAEQALGSESVQQRYGARLARMTELNRESAARSGLTAEDVAQAVEKCLRVRRVRHRYELGLDARLGTVLGRWLPTRLVDALFARLVQAGPLRLPRPTAELVAQNSTTPGE